MFYFTNRVISIWNHTLQLLLDKNIVNYFAVSSGWTGEKDVTAQLFPRCDLYTAPSTKNRYIKYAVCELNLKISLDPKPSPNHNPKPIRNPNPFPVPNPMPLTSGFSYNNHISPGKKL